MILGLDTSRWEDNPATPVTIDWHKAKAAGAEFVIMKATEGTSYTDPVFQLHKANSAGILPRGSYHFWRANQDIKAQAAHYFSVAGKMDMPPVLDVEDWYGDLPKGAVLESKVIAMLTEIDRVFGRECMIYTSPNIIKYYLALTPSSPLCRRKLWVAHYGVAAPSIAPFPRWSIWQFSETGSAAKYGITEATSVDENWYNGTQEDFNAEFLDITPEPETKITIQAVNVDGVPIQKLVAVHYLFGNVPHIQLIDQRPPIEPQPTAGLFRIKSDTQAGVVPTGTRPYIRNGLPCTVRLQGGKGAVLLSPAWMAYVYAINTGKARNYQFEAPAVLKDAVGWHNQGEDNRVEQVVFGGNVLEVLRIEGDRAYIKTLFNDQAPPAQVFPMDANNPLVHNFSIQYSSRLDISTDGRYARTLVIANPGEQLYLSVKELVKVI